MANTKSAEKRTRQNITRTQRNKSVKTRVKNTRRGVVEAIEGKDKTVIAAKVSGLASAADKAVKSGVIHKNKANRLKSRATKAAAAVK
jgi:small subunit ribosomal protein S20